MSSVTRTIQKNIENHIKPQKAILIFGARRVGKTVLLKQIISGHEGRSLLLNGESMDTLRLLEDRSISNYRNLFGSISLLAIDEAQHIPDIGMKLKLIVDEVPGVSVIATGSSSFDLKNIAGEPLVGRSTQFLLTPFSIEEIISSSTSFEFLQKVEEYLIFGHYPELLCMDNISERKEYLNEVVDAYLLRDILAVDGIKHAQKMHDLLRLIAYQTGSEVSLEELGKQLSLSRNTIERYLDLLQKVFVLYRLGGFSKNLRKEVGKSSKWYFYDTGIRNAVLRDFTPFRQRSDSERGSLWENYVISDRIKRSLNHRLGLQFYFWRTYDQQEIDLVETDGENMSAFELKSGTKSPSAPKAYTKTYPDSSFNVINRGNLLDWIL